MPEEKVIAAVRCRPLIAKEINEGCQTCLEFVPNEPQIVLGKDRAFTFDFVFSPKDFQGHVYETAVKQLVDGIFKGYNATVLAYGQTGSGKTFTMGGCYETSLSETGAEMGIIPRALQDIFSGIEDRPESKFDLRVSYLEIYNEDILDLFSPPSQRENLPIREELSGEIKIPGLQELTVKSCDETLERLVRGSQGRTTGATAMNATSSRSHAIFTIYIRQQKVDDPADCWKAKFHLVDLAGSERVKRTHAEGERLREGISINKGLLCLGNVISALGDENQRKGHIPYRNSKLTRLLQDSLGGNSQTLMIACVSPADSNLEETLNTLRYADRARNIKNKPIVNRDPQTAEIMRLKSLVQELQSQLVQGANAICNVSHSISSDSQESRDDLKTIMERNRLLEEENMKLTQELERAVDQNTRMCERAIKLELSRDRLQGRLLSLKQQTGVNFDLLSSSMDVESNPLLKVELEKLQTLAQQFARTESSGEEEIEELDLEQAEEHEENVGATELPSTPDSRAFSTRHALRQAEMGRELQELNRLLAKKEELASQMCQNDDKMDVMRLQYELAAKELERDIQKLQNEKDELMIALQEAKTHSAANKISEQRRRRLQELEQQLTGMRRKLVEQSKAAKLKEQSEKQVGKLNYEIQAMKQHRVKLMKQMKEDSENFRKWKQEKNKEVLQLMQKDRKRQFELQKIQKNHEKQENVLRRKADEAAAANKRLKELLAKQQHVQKERNEKFETNDNAATGHRVRSWLGHELEIRVGIREAKYHLESLLADRKELSQQVKKLKEELEERPTKRMAWMDACGDMHEASFDADKLQKQITTLELEIEARNSQITDIQQKIMDADLDSKRKSTWDCVKTMLEAKCALKWLLEQAVSSRADHSVSRSELRNLQQTSDDHGQAVEKMEQQMKGLEQRYQTEITQLQRQHEDKVLYLLRQLRERQQPADQSLDEETKRRLKFQEEEINKLSDLHEQLQKKTEECEALKKQLTRAMYQGKTLALLPNISDPSASPFLTPSVKALEKPERKKRTEKEVVENADFSETDSETEEEEQDDDDEWQRTPLFVRRKPKKKAVAEGPRCACKGTCSTKQCGCRKLGVRCNEKTCGCNADKCRNKEQDPSADNDNSTGSTSALLNNTFCVSSNQSQQSLSHSDSSQDGHDQQLEPAGKKRKARATVKKFNLDDARSSEEFERPAIPEVKSLTVTKKSKARPALREVENSEDPSLSEFEMTTPRSEGESLLEGGLRRKRKLINMTQSFFSPLT